MSERYTPEQIRERDEIIGRAYAQDARDLAALRFAAQDLIDALDRTDIWDDDQPVPIMQAAGEAVGRLRALLPSADQGRDG